MMGFSVPVLPHIPTPAPGRHGHADDCGPISRSGMIIAPSGDMIMKSKMIENCSAAVGSDQGKCGHAARQESAARINSMSSTTTIQNASRPGAVRLSAR
jgi:hypothetical protein